VEFRKPAGTSQPTPHKPSVYGAFPPKVRGLRFASSVAWVILKVNFNFNQQPGPQKRL